MSIIHFQDGVTVLEEVDLMGDQNGGFVVLQPIVQVVVDLPAHLGINS